MTRHNQSALTPDVALVRYLASRNRAMLERRSGTPASDAVLGSLLGLAVGDAVGCPFEGLDFKRIRHGYGDLTRADVPALLFGPHANRWRLPGLHSDDTQQALAVVDSLRAARADSTSSTDLADAVAERVAETFVQGSRASVPRGSSREPHSFGCWRGTGGGFRSVVSKLVEAPKTKSWHYQAAVDSAGLGASMRVPPLGVLARDRSEMLALVDAVTRVTHSDPLAQTSAVAAAETCRVLTEVRRRTVDIRALVEHVRGTVSAVEDEFLAADPRSADQGRLRLMSVLLGDAIARRHDDPRDWMQAIRARCAEANLTAGPATAGFGPSGVAAALCFFLASPASPQKALLSAISAGGDTDTVGAIVGSFCGALHGVAAFEAWLPYLVGLDLILEVADSVDRGGPPAELVAQETALTELEIDLDATMRRLS